MENETLRWKAHLNKHEFPVMVCTGPHLFLEVSGGVGVFGFFLSETQRGHISSSSSSPSFTESINF